jgi:hypothetical protein
LQRLQAIWLTYTFDLSDTFTQTTKCPLLTDFSLCLLGSVLVVVVSSKPQIRGFKIYSSNINFEKQKHNDQLGLLE